MIQCPTAAQLSEQAQTNPFRYKKRSKNSVRSEAKSRGEKEKKMQIQNQVAKTQNMASHRRR
jgi:hypothetical protein